VSKSMLQQIVHRMLSETLFKRLQNLILLPSNFMVYFNESKIYFHQMDDFFFKTIFQCVSMGPKKEWVWGDFPRGSRQSISSWISFRTNNQNVLLTDAATSTSTSMSAAPQFHNRHQQKGQKSQKSETRKAVCQCFCAEFVGGMCVNGKWKRTRTAS